LGLGARWADGLQVRLSIQGNGMAHDASLAPGAAPAGQPLRLDPFIGRRLKRYWPHDGGWFDGVITDFNAATGEHWCVRRGLGA
jgi:hypothetical protein